MTVAAHASAADLDRLSRRFQGLQLRFASLQGQSREKTLQLNRLTKSISLAKARLELAPQAAEVFTYLQDKAHRRAVGQFEDLLSAFVADVIPDAGTIRLELGTERGAPALDILLDNGGDLENIMTGNGGGLTNVVVAGLGYSALSRTRNRQLMLLDEPDCWLKAINVPAFTKVIAEVANPRPDEDGKSLPGCQTLMVSHNDIALMDEGAHIQDLRTELGLSAFAARHGVEVVHVGTPGPCAYVVWVDRPHAKSTIEVRYRDDGTGDDENNALTKGYPVLDSISGARAWDDAAQPGLRWIEVSNLRRHVHTRMELSSGLNVMTGGVNGGKSTLYFTALRAMAYGETDDTFIRHGADCAIVRIGLENDVVLEMVRQRKLSPKVTYRLFRAGVKVHESRQENRSSVPEFISDALQVQRVDGMDIQLRSQKEPVFLLNEAASRRAQLLSVGRESGLLHELIERQRLQVRRDREDVKREEIELNSVSRALKVMAPLASMAALADIMGGLFEEAVRLNGAVTKCRDLVARLAPLEGKARLHALCTGKLEATPRAPALGDTVNLASLLARLAPLEAKSKLHARYATGLVADLSAPHLTVTAPLSALIGRLAATAGAACIADLPGTPAARTLTDIAPLGRLTARLSAGQGAASMLDKLPGLPAEPRLTDTRQLREAGVALSTRTAGLADADKEHVAVAGEYTAAEESLHQLKHELGVCPVCAQPFDEVTHGV